VRRRVQAGGHDVPEAVVRRRVYDGSALARRPMVARGGKDQITVVLDDALWRGIRKQMEVAG